MSKEKSEPQKPQERPSSKPLRPQTNDNDYFEKGMGSQKRPKK